ncbi:MAG: C39 family peptidase [Lentisphaeria bacterium]|nr:C39 family peptidase [Lentisphaeria bacterium]
MPKFFTIRTFFLLTLIFVFLPQTVPGKTENYSQNVKVRGQVWKNKYKVSIDKVPHIKQRSSNCVPATVAMNLRYYDTTIGQNNLAKLFHTSKRGTNHSNMMQGFANKDLQKFSIKRIYTTDQSENTAINKELNKLLQNPDAVKDKNIRQSLKKLAKDKRLDHNTLLNKHYRLARWIFARGKVTLRKNFQERFTGYLQAGLPLLWSVDMRLDPTYRDSSGHMRVIIGYFVKDNQITHIIYRDSWRGGSVGDTMTFDEAVAMTNAVFLITPRDLDPEKAPRVKLSGKAPADR